MSCGDYDPDTYEGVGWRRPTLEQFNRSCAYWYNDALKKDVMLIPVTVTCDEGRPLETFTVDVPLDTEDATVADLASKTLPPNPAPKVRATWDKLYLNGVEIPGPVNSVPKIPDAPDTRHAVYPSRAKDDAPPYFDSDPPGRLVTEKLPDLAAPRPVPVFMSDDSATRKRMPIASGALAYFPDALLLVSWVSRVGNEKHCAGRPLHWDKSKSSDEKDAEVRHMIDALRGLPPDPGLEPLGDLGHLASKAWRALADLQRGCDEERQKYNNTKGQ